MAEMIFVQMLKAQGLEHEFMVASRATSDEEIIRGVGNPLYPPARAELARRGIPILPHRAKQLVRADYDAYDWIIGMDRSNMQAMHRLFGSDPDQKLFKLLSFAGREGDVADPWYSGRFDIAYDDISAGCAGLLAYLGER